MWKLILGGVWAEALCLVLRESQAAAMTTVLENMQTQETLKREIDSRKEWAKNHAQDALIFPPESEKNVRLRELKAQVADLCDLQPTPASMLRPPRKVRSRSPQRPCTRRLACACTRPDPFANPLDLRAPRRL